MDDFLRDKNNVLGRADKSKKGSIDKPIRKLVSFINSLSDYYTTSSCSGRIIILYRKSEKKNDVRWVFTSHSPVSFEEVSEAIRNVPKHDMWIKEESAILHVRARTISDAQRLVDIARTVGFKRTGIQSTRKKIHVEICSSENLHAIISKDSEIIVSPEYLKVLISESNKKMRHNFERIERFYSLAEKELG